MKEEDRLEGFIRKLNFKRTWGIIVDATDTSYYFDVKDMDMDPFSVREGMSASFHRIADSSRPGGMDFRATNVRLKRD